MKKVQLIQVGQADLDVNLKEIMRLANKVQSQYDFFIGDQLTKLGDPLGDSGNYLPKTLLDLLISNRSDDANAITVGITYVPLHEEILSTVDQNNQAVLVTTHPDLTEPFLSRVKTNPTQWVMFEIAAQLLTIEYRCRTKIQIDPQDCGLPWHKELSSCIFDYNDVIADTSKKLMSPDVCSTCEYNLDKANIGDSVRSAIKSIINRALRIRLKVAILLIIDNPLFNLFAGGLIVTALYDWFVDYFYPDPARLMYPLLGCVVVAVLLVLRKSPKL